MASKERIIVIGVDFGTTFSGIAWAISGDDTGVHYIDSWPQATGSNRISAKVPTRMRQVEEDGGWQWGFQIPADTPSEEVLKCFKL